MLRWWSLRDKCLKRFHSGWILLELYAPHRNYATLFDPFSPRYNIDVNQGGNFE